MIRDEAKKVIRSRVSCRDYLIPSKSGLYCCPFCKSGTGPNQTGALKLYDTNTFTCHACGKSGDIFDLYQQEKGVDFNTALMELAEIAGIEIDRMKFNSQKPTQASFNGRDNIKTHPESETQQRASESVSEEEKDFTEYYEKCAACLQDEVQGKEGIAYLENRRTLGTALYYGGGYDKAKRRIIIPCSKRFYLARSIDPDTQLRYDNPKGVRSELFNKEVLYAQDVQEVFITEGVFDALSVIEAGGQAVSLNSGKNAKKLIKILEEAPTAATIIICQDKDEEGDRTTQVLQEGLTRLNIPFIMGDINLGCKDQNDACKKDYYAFYDAVQDCIAEARAYREELRDRTRKEEIERQQRTGAGMIDSFLEAVRSRKYEPIPTGITDIDKALYGGFTRQTLILLGAAPGAGKTALTQWVFEGMAERGTSCVYLNLEMSRDQILARSISRIARKNGDRITPAEVKQGYSWDFAQEEMVMAAAEKYKQAIAPRMIYNPDGVTSDLDSIMKYIEAEATRAEAAGMQAPLIVLDYLQIVTGREREDDTTLIKRAVASLKQFAIKHDTVVFCIIAHNRAANQSGTVSQESGRDTSALEYSADLQLGLAYTRCLKRNGYERKAKEDLTPEEMRYVTIKVTKGRDAKIGAEVDLFFDGETMTYTQLEKEREEPGLPQKAGRKPKR